MGDIPIVKAVSGVIGAIALFTCVISGIRLVERGGDASKIGQASRDPESFTLQKLIARGPDGNVNVRVSEFALDQQQVTQTWKTNTGVKGIDHIWVVARVPGAPNDAPVRVLVRARGSDGADDLRRAREFQGLVINKIDRPNEEEMKLLRGAYPGFDPARVLLIDSFRDPPGQLAAFNATVSAIAGGVAFICAIVFFWDWLPSMTPKTRKKKGRRSVEDEDDE